LTAKVSVMPKKKHVYIPDWLDTRLKEAISRGYFANEAEAFRTGLMLAVTLPDLSRGSPELEFALYDQVSKQINHAKEEVERYEIPAAVETLRYVGNVLAYRTALSPITDQNPESLESLRTVNTVFFDSLASLDKLVRTNTKRDELRKALSELEILEHLNFLSIAYHDLAKARYDQRVKQRIEQ